MPYILCTVNFMTNSKVLAKSLVTTELRAKFNVFDFITINNKSNTSAMMCSASITSTTQHYYHATWDACTTLYTLHAAHAASSHRGSGGSGSGSSHLPRTSLHISQHNHAATTTQHSTCCRRVTAGRKYSWFTKCNRNKLKQ